MCPEQLILARQNPSAALKKRETRLRVTRPSLQTSAQSKTCTPQPPLPRATRHLQRAGASASRGRPRRRTWRSPGVRPLPAAGPASGEAPLVPPRARARPQLRRPPSCGKCGSFRVPHPLGSAWQQLRRPEASETLRLVGAQIGLASEPCPGNESPARPLAAG